MGCKATTKAGKPCKAAPLKESDFCLAHSDADTRASSGFVPENGKLGGRPRKPRLNEIYEQVGEEMREKVREVLNDGLNAERAVVVGNGPSATVEMVPDHPHRLKVASEIMDRLHGKPRQTTELTGADGGPVEFAGIDPNFNGSDWFAEVAKAIHSSGAADADTDQDQ